MQLNPQEEFVIARGLEDHTDSTTYYVRAFVRNAKTDALLATLDLTDQGDSHRFSKKYFVPADPTGEGYYLLITTSVYTDSGYTTKAEMYGDKYETYLVDQRAKRFGGGGGGGTDIDYKKVRTIVEEVVGQKIAEIPPAPPIPPVNITPQLQPVLNAISGVKNDVRSIEIPPSDYSGIERRLDLLQTAIEDKEVTPATEIQPIMDKLDSMGAEIKPQTEKASQDISGLFERVKQFFTADMEAILKRITGLEQKFDNIPYVVIQPKQNDTKPQEEAIDYPSLLNS